MERDRSPTRAVRIPTSDECYKKFDQIDAKQTEEEAKKKQSRIDEQRKQVAKFLETRQHPLERFSTKERLSIRNELVLCGWHVDSPVSGDISYEITRLRTDHINRLSRGYALDPINDELVELSINATLREEHHNCQEEIEMIRGCLEEGISTFWTFKLSKETEQVLDESGYACIEMCMHGKEFEYHIIPKEQYDRVKAKIANK